MNENNITDDGLYHMSDEEWKSNLAVDCTFR